MNRVCWTVAAAALLAAVVAVSPPGQGASAVGEPYYDMGGWSGIVEQDSTRTETYASGLVITRTSSADVRVVERELGPAGQLVRVVLSQVTETPWYCENEIIGGQFREDVRWEGPGQMKVRGLASFSYLEQDEPYEVAIDVDEVGAVGTVITHRCDGTVVTSELPWYRVPSFANTPVGSEQIALAPPPAPTDLEFSSAFGSESDELELEDPQWVTFGRYAWRLTTLEDTDGDGVPDTRDCRDDVPDPIGDPCAAPDRDFDGVPDDDDLCPDTHGSPPDGCPTGSCPLSPSVDIEWHPWSLTVSAQVDSDGATTIAWGDSDVVNVPAQAHVTMSHVYATAGPRTVTVTTRKEFCDDQSAEDFIVVNPIDYFSPAVAFHPDEKFFIGDPNEFIANSNLRFADGPGACRNRVLARGANVAAAGATPLEPSLLGLEAGEYAYSVGADCALGDAPYPAVNTGVVLKEERHLPGYFLDLVTPATRRGSLDAPMYAEWFDGAGRVDGQPTIVYWLFYPHNDWDLTRAECSRALPVGTPRRAVLFPLCMRVREIHEGDWERVIVRLNPFTLEADTIDFYQHYCEPPERKTYDELERTGVDGHFIVYSARGGHASFPNDGGDGGLQLSCSSFDFVGRGVIWTHGYEPVRNVRDEPWYGFGGAWGDRSERSIHVDDVPFGGLLDNYGPSGPGRPGRDATAP